MSRGRATIVFDVSGHGFGHLAQVAPSSGIAEAVEYIRSVLQ